MKDGQSQGPVPVEAFPLPEQGSERQDVWLQFGGVNSFNKLQYLNHCLVGKWGGSNGGGSVDILFGGLGQVSLEAERESIVVTFGRAMDSI